MSLRRHDICVFTRPQCTDISEKEKKHPLQDTWTYNNMLHFQTEVQAAACVAALRQEYCAEGHSNSVLVY